MLTIFLAVLVVLIHSEAATAQQPRECPDGVLSAGSAVSAALESTDCRFSDLVAGVTSTSFAKRYRLTVSEGAVATLTMTAAEYPAALAIYTVQGRIVGSNAATAPAGTARIVINLPAGSYTAIAFSTRTAAVGAFELKLEAEPPRTCQTLELPADGVTEGAFSNSSCRFVDLIELSANVSNVAFFRFPIAQRGVTVIEADTAMARFTTVVATQALQAFSGAKRLTVSLPAGTHSASVSSPESGSFTLRTKTEGPRTCPTAAIKVGEEVTGKLEASGCRWLDVVTPSSDATPLQLYRFTADSRIVAQIDQTSAEVDSYLALYTVTPTAQVANNDDASPVTRDSRILVNLPPAEYLLFASAYDETTLGAYTLKIAGEPPRKCDATPLSSGATVDGQVPDTGCRILDYISLSTATDIAAPFLFDAAQPAMLSLKAEGALTGTLRMINSAGREVSRLASDRNGEIAGEVRVLAGPHTLLMTNTAAAKPSFKLGAQTREIPACTVNPLALDSEAENVITALECRYSELVNYTTAAAAAQLFQVELPVRGRLTVEVESAVFPPVLAVLRPTGEPLGVTFSQAPGKVTLPDGLLSAGAYRVVVTSLNGNTLGAFKVRNRFTPEAGPAAAEAFSVPQARDAWLRLHEDPASQPGAAAPTADAERFGRVPK